MEKGEDGVQGNCTNPRYVETPLQNINTDRNVAMSEKKLSCRGSGNPKTSVTPITLSKLSEIQLTRSRHTMWKTRLASYCLWCPEERRSYQ